MFETIVRERIIEDYDDWNTEKRPEKNEAGKQEKKTWNRRKKIKNLGE